MVYNVSRIVGVLNSKCGYFTGFLANHDEVFCFFSHLSSLCLCENCRSSWLCVKVFVFVVDKYTLSPFRLQDVGRKQNALPSDYNETNLWKGVMGARLESEGKNLTSSTS